MKKDYYCCCCCPPYFIIFKRQAYASRAINKAWQKYIVTKSWLLRIGISPMHITCIKSVSFSSHVPFLYNYREYQGFLTGHMRPTNQTTENLLEQSIGNCA